ncbi:MAG: NADH-quinone oxidoreductase subunit C [Rhodothermales bacterium]
MRDDVRNVKPRVDPDQEKQVLKFHFTPVAPPNEAEATQNPHAKATTQVADVIEALREEFGDAAGETVVYAGEHTVYVDRDRIVDVCRFLKESQGFNYLSDLGANDRFTEEDRFEVFYNLVSMQGRKRIRVKLRTDEDTPVPSVTGVYRAANWHEREAWDMMGIRFDGHPDLRRMFMPEDFEFHPQRKEFPTLGIPGSLPLPPQHTGGALTADPFARAHGDVPTD